MRTVPTLCAFGAGIPTAVVQLVLAAIPDEAHPHPYSPTSSTTANTHSSVQRAQMTAVATYTVSRAADLDLRDSRAFSSPIPPRTVLGDEDGHRGTTPLSRPSSKKRRSLTPHANDAELPQAPPSRPHSWMRRWSSNISASRDLGRTPSRPVSAVVSYSNGSGAFSQTGSSTPIMFSDSTPPSLPPNKLVKRASSLRSSNGSPYTSSDSRLPLPIFKRPATSHQRSFTLQGSSVDTPSDRMSFDDQLRDARDPRWRHYFTPRIASDEIILGRRRSSTGIPNPIKRVYPHRKYSPVLVSSKELVRAAGVEIDDGLSDSEAETSLTRPELAASSPLPSRTSRFETGTTHKRSSFSLSTPLWKRASTSRSRTAPNKLTRRSRQRVVSAPHASMGSSISTNADSERPTKRRETAYRERSICSSSSSANDSDLRTVNEIQLNLKSTTPPPARFVKGTSPTPGTSFNEETSPLEQRRSPLATFDSAAARHARVSATHSEITSTAGSDSEHQSVSGYSTDYQSDTVYDSLPIRTTRSSSGKRGPPIETIFDDSPPTYSSGRSTKLRDFLSEGAFPNGDNNGARHRHSTIEEEGSIISTPVRSLRDKSVTSTPSTRPGARHVSSSLPPAMSIMPDPDEIDWDALEDFESPDRGLGIQQTTPFTSNPLLDPSVALPFRLGALSRSANGVSPKATPSRHGNGAVDRASLFDWSEQQPSPSHNNSPPRPRTVHGKKDPESRGSRSTGRRAPSGMHARSHSVPVVPDVEGKRPSVVANKFGTWGVGSKAVTEDWNEDFDFDEAPLPLPAAVQADEKRIDSGHAMFVPKSIREQQESVVANIGLLREWGLLIEELKDLRIRAFALNMLNGNGLYAQAWREVDAMIELADQESEENTLEPRRSPPSSPGFDYTAFEEPLGLFGTNDGGKARSGSIRFGGPIAPPDSDMAQPDAGKNGQQSPPPPVTLITRPRKDSEAVARSVIEALQMKRRISDTAALNKPNATMKKVPFDTATLRHIVPYVNGLKRKVKDGLRETEGLYSSPRRRSSDESERCDDRKEQPAFRSIFNEPETSSRTRTRRDMATTDHDGFDEPFMTQSTSRQ